MGCTRRIKERFNYYWPSISNAAFRLTAIAQAVVDSRPVANLCEGMSHVLRLPEFFQKRISKETTAIIKQAAINSISYAAVPFVYYSALKPKVESFFGESAILSMTNCLAYSVFIYLFTRRLVDYTIDAVRIPYAVNEDLTQEHIAVFLQSLLEKLTLLYGRSFSNASKSIKDTLYHNLKLAFANSTFKNFTADETRQKLIKNIEYALLHTFFDDPGSNVLPSRWPKKIAKPLADLILDALNTVLVTKPANLNLFEFLGSRHSKKLFEAFKLIFPETADQLAIQTVDSVFTVAKEMQANIKPPVYEACKCDIQKKMNLAIRSPFYYINNMLSAGLVSWLVSFVNPTLGSLVGMTAWSLLYGQSALEYRLASSGMCVADRYEVFAKTNLFCIGFGASNLLLTKLLTLPVSYFYGANSWFITDAAANFVLQLNLVSLLIDKKPVPEDPFRVDVSYFPRKGVDYAYDKGIKKIMPKLIKLNDEKELCVKKIKNFLTSAPLSWSVALALGDPVFFSKFFTGNVQKSELELLNIIFSIPSVKALTQTFEPNIMATLSTLERLRYFSFVLTSPLVQKNPILFLFMPYVAMSLLSLPIHIVNDNGFEDVLKQIYLHVQRVRENPDGKNEVIEVKFSKDQTIEGAMNTELKESTALVSQERKPAQLEKIEHIKGEGSAATELKLSSTGETLRALAEAKVQQENVARSEIKSEGKEQQDVVSTAPVVNKPELLLNLKENYSNNTSVKVSFSAKPNSRGRVLYLKTAAAASAAKDPQSSLFPDGDAKELKTLSLKT